MTNEYGKVSSRTFKHMKKGIVFMANHNHIENVYALPHIGSGHDGFVFEYGDLALKLLKYDISKRSKDKLMTFEKASFFCRNLKLKRIEAPIDILLDEDGIFSGYVMHRIEDLASEKYVGTPIAKKPGEFTCGQLLWAASELGEDFSQLSSKGIKAKDINAGSFLYPADYVHLCDVDKYQLSKDSSLERENMQKYRYTLARLLYLQMGQGCSKEELKALNTWVKRCSNNPAFVKELSSDIGSCFSEPISEFASHKAKVLLR